ncbi:polyketide synthetase [Mycena floridula]|nr:polyketide synthetase [Mycena floridula]
MEDPSNMLDLLFYHAQKSPQRPCLVEDHDTALTYRQAWLVTRELIAPRLPDRLPQSRPSNSKVILLCSNSALFPLAMWAFWMMSVTVVPLNPSSDSAIWGDMISVVNPEYVVVEKRLHHTLKNILADQYTDRLFQIEDLIMPPTFSSKIQDNRCISAVLAWLEDTTVPQELLPLPVPITDSELCLTLFTSSAVDRSTVKCVSYTHSMIYQAGRRAVLNLGDSSYQQHPIRHVGWLPLSHAFELLVGFLGIIAQTGGTYIFFDRSVSSPTSSANIPLSKLLLHAISYHQPVDNFFAVPSTFSEIIKVTTDTDIQHLRRLKSLGVGGAPTQVAVFAWAVENNIPYFDCSGSTEMCGMICIRRALDPSTRQHGLRVIEGLEGRLLKEDPIDDFGELIISGTHLPRRYANINDPWDFDSLTAKVTYYTGDIYKQHSEVKEPYLAGLTYVGRKDDLVVLSSGTKVDVLPIERTLDALPDIRRSAIIGNLDSTSLVVLVEPTVDPFTKARTADLVDKILTVNVSLRYEDRIKRDNIHIVDALPVTGKLTLNRKKVKKLFKDGQGIWPYPLQIPNQPQIAAILMTSNEVREQVLLILQEIFSIPPSQLNDDSFFMQVPLTSLSSVHLANALQSRFAITVTAPQMFGIQSIDDLCSLITAKPHSDSPNRLFSNPPDTTDSLHITGASCALAGDINSLAALWQALMGPDDFSNRLAKTSVSRSSEFSLNGDGTRLPVGRLDPDIFDNDAALSEFFSLTPDTVKSMAPTARLVLQLGYRAIEDAGVAPRSLNGKRWGVFTAVSDSGWREHRLSKIGPEEYGESLNGSADDAAGARLAYYLNLVGPSMDIKTACSSSAVAIHQASLAIRNQDCDAALVIAATCHFHESASIFRSKAGIASPTGRCKTFSDAADGFFPSEGAVAIVIQKSVDVTCQPYAKLRTTAIAQDGKSRGFFSPNPRAQSSLISDALRRANCSPDDISYFEAHGTGTRMGDAVELAAIKTVFASRSSPLIVGAAKAVFGHHEECAGLTSLLKAIACFSSHSIPPQPHIEVFNREINLESSSIIVPQLPLPLPENVQGQALIGISSFGLSGTLAHIILQNPEPEPDVEVISSPPIFLLSARSESAFTALASDFETFIASPGASYIQYHRACRTTQIGRDHFRFRRAWKLDSWKSLAIQLPCQPYFSLSPPRIGLWFSGTQELSVPTFLKPISTDFLAEFNNWAPQCASYGQRLLIARLLARLGCNITAVSGEGAAEYVAAIFSGAIPSSIPNFGLISKTALAPGKELHTFVCPLGELEESLLAWSPEELRTIGKYGRDMFGVVGNPSALKALAEEIGIQSLPHSTLTLAWAGESTDLRAPQIPIVSSHLGCVLSKDLSSNLNYWKWMNDRPVNCVAAWESLAQLCDIVINVGTTGAVSAHFGDRCLSLHDTSFESLLAKLFESGCNLDWNAFGDKKVAHIPTYHWA